MQIAKSFISPVASIGQHDQLILVVTLIGEAPRPGQSCIMSEMRRSLVQASIPFQQSAYSAWNFKRSSQGNIMDCDHRGLVEETGRRVHQCCGNYVHCRDSETAARQYETCGVVGAVCV